MLRFHPSRIGWILVLTLGLWAAVAQARDFRYCYVSLDEVPVPSGFVFFTPAAIDNSNRIYGTTALDDGSFLLYVAVYAHGTVTVLQPGFAYAANEHRTIGGSVVIDTENFFEQAALFRGRRVKLIPPQPFELTSFVTKLNDRGTALVQSFDTDGVRTDLLYRHGQATPLLDLGLTATNPALLSINNQGIIAGRTGNAFAGARGFRFNPRTGETMLLNPFPGDPTETLAWGMDINNRGDVLGYSFTIGVVPYHERIGVWDRNGNFKTYFVENTNTRRLLFNDNKLIVITLVSSGSSESGNSYLVPKPGVRLNLATLVKNLPSGANLNAIDDLNNHGNMIGSGSLGEFFLLERIDKDESCTTPAGAS